ncbi:hypothetical protein BGX28_002485 [Mortierella sp. GBA30]|nr:hypothetical protein BGX28_002485 [Mortierella sp. GBA30]
MGFLFGFLCGLLFIPLSILAGLYYYFTYSESYAEKREEQLQQEKLRQQEQDLDLDDMPSALYASYLGSRQQAGVGNNSLIPEHLDPQYQFAGWISVKRIPEVDHRIIEPSVKKETKRHVNKNGNANSRNRSPAGGLLDDTGSLGAAAAAQDPRFTYLDTQNPHLTLPPCLQARFKDSKYGVVKGATMFIYENEYMEECLGVITVPNYQISVPGHQKDGHIFSKRNPIWLKYQPASSHTRHSTASSEGSVSSAKDYYLSMVNCVDKEDLYFTLLRCSKLKLNSRPYIREIPKRDSTLFDKSAMNTLIRTIHSNEHQFQAAWLNALLGRMFLGVYKTPQIKDMIFQKMVDKLSRVRLPNFLNDMRMKSVHLGDGVPYITRPKLLTLKPNGDMIMDMSLLYQGGFRAEVEAEAVVTVTKKIQPIKVSLVLVMTLVRLEGRVQAWIKPPPCNRIWYGFYQKPQVEMKIEPVVSDKHIKSNLIIKAIENKMLEAIAETMVLPNMDDIPFSDSEGIGGIFGEEILPGGESASQQTAPKVPPKRTHSPGPRSATINITESSSSSSNAPRSALELSGDLRHRADTASLPPLYKNHIGSRSHASLGDELMQTNYTYDNQSRMTNAPDDDPMRTGVLRSGQLAESPEEIPQRMLQVPGGRGNQVDNDSGSGVIQESGSSASSSNSRLFNRKVAGHTSGPAGFGARRGSVDPGMTLAYSTGSAAASASSSSQFSSMESVRTVEEHWSQYGISEYEPSLPEGGKITAKDRKKLKEKMKNADKEKTGVEGDRVSVHSKDSGDTGSTHTGNTLWTENTGQASSIFGSSSSHSTIEAGGQSPSTRTDKFSLTKMFQGFRKKHTKGAHSGSSLQMLSNPASAQGEHDPQFVRSVLAEDEEGGVHDAETASYNDLDDAQALASTSGNLLSAYQPQFRQKFESTPNLSSALYSAEPEEGTVSESGIPLSGQEEYEVGAERHEGSPVPSVYAASLFGGEDPSLLSGNSRASPHPQNHHLLNFSPKFGTALRKLTRSHAGSGSSRDELSIPTGDLNAVLKLQQQGLSGSESSSQISLSAGGPSGSSSDLELRHAETLEDEQFPRDVDGPFIPVSVSQPELVYPSRTTATRVIAAPLIVLQKPSPHLAQGGPSSPLYAEGTFVADGYHERASMDDSRLQQHIPERLSLSQQPVSLADARVDRNLTSNEAPSSPSNGNLASPASRPRRHSINHPPSISPAGYNILQHIHAHGLGVTPASPLRKEFSRDDDEVNTSPTVALSEGSTGGRTRNSSDTASLNSTTPSSSQSSTPRDTPQGHHSSALRHILSSLGSKGKRRGSTPTQGSTQNGQDPFSTVGIVGMVGVMAIGRVVTSHGTDGDPFAEVGGVDELGEPRGTSQEHVGLSPLRNSALDSPPEVNPNGGTESNIEAPKEDSPSLWKERVEGKPTKYGSQEILHARPGYVGEYPTPIRMHSRLNREAAAIRSLKTRGEGEGRDQGRYSSQGSDQALKSTAGLSSPRQDPRAIQGSESLISKSTTLPLPTMGALLPDSLPVVSAGEMTQTAAAAMPLETPKSETSTVSSVNYASSSLSASSQSSKDSTAMEMAMNAGKQRQFSPTEGNLLQDQQHQRSSSDGSYHTMTRCEYDVMMKSRRPSLQPSPLEEKVPERCSPLLNGAQSQKHSEPLPRLEEPSSDSKRSSVDQQQLKVKVDQMSESDTDGSQFLQPSSSQSSSPSSASIKKIQHHHRNIFKRLIRRKSDDATLRQERQQPHQQQQQLRSKPAIHIRAALLTRMTLKISSKSTRHRLRFRCSIRKNH